MRATQSRPVPQVYPGAKVLRCFQVTHPLFPTITHPTASLTHRDTFCFTPFSFFHVAFLIISFLELLRWPPSPPPLSLTKAAGEGGVPGESRYSLPHEHHLCPPASFSPPPLPLLLPQPRTPARHTTLSPPPCPLTTLSIPLNPLVFLFIL